MHILVLLLLLGSGGRMKHQEARVDLVELNYHFEDGRLLYTQVIFWEWSHDWRRHHVVDWYISQKLEDMPTIVSSGKYMCLKNGWMVFADNMRTTFTSGHDPERENQKVFPPRYRRGVAR